MISHDHLQLVPELPTEVSWEAQITPELVRMRFGDQHVGLTRADGLRLGHAILCGYGALLYTQFDQ